MGFYVLSLVQLTINKLLEKLDGNIHPQAILHSEQGVHYTHPKIRLLIKNAGIRQSLSQKGNCLGNASMELFFGHMKDELNFKSCFTGGTSTTDAFRLRLALSNETI